MSDCVLWGGAVFKSGYGVKAKGRTAALAHRVAYEREFGEIPAGAVVHHECGNRLCVNVAHLKLMTLPDHTRMHHSQVRNGRCKRGHDMTDPANVYLYARRRNVACRACRTEAVRKYRRKRERSADAA